MTSSRRLAVWLIGGFCASGIAPTLQAADWQEPKNDLVTEKETVSYCQIYKEMVENWRAAGKAVEGSQSSAAALAMTLRTDEKFKASVASHGMTLDEYSWVGNKLLQAWGDLQREQLIAEATKGIEQQRKTNQQKLTDLKAKLAQYQKAQADGRRVMTKDDRDAAVASAKSDEQTMLDEAKQHGEEVAAAHQEFTKAQSDAAAAEALAKNPPSDVSADDRASYIDQKKSEAQSFRDAAKEAKTKEDEAAKAQNESKAKAAAMHGKVANPDLPTTDDEKAEVKKQNEEMIANTKSEITDTENGMKLLAESTGSIQKSLQANDKDRPLPENLEMLRKHRGEYEKALGFIPPSQGK